MFNNNFIEKVLSILLVVLFVISAVLLVAFFTSVVPLEESAQMESGITSTFLNWAYFLAIVCAIAAVLFPLLEFVRNLIDDPKSAIKPLAIIACLAIILGISYGIASGDLSSITHTSVPTTEGELKWSGTGLNVTYILLGLNILAIIYLEVSKKLK